MLIPIPIGAKTTAAAEGATLKVVSCEHCHQNYAYRLELRAIGVDHNLLFLDSEGSARRAQAQAEQNLLKMCRNVVRPVPCPNCGFYQDDMVKLIKEQGMSKGPVISGLVVAALSLVPLAFEIPNIWVLTAAGVFAGLSLVAYADVAASRFDPNAGDPDRRKARGRKDAVWGEQLTELLTTIPNAEQNALTERTCESSGLSHNQKPE